MTEKKVSRDIYGEIDNFVAKLKEAGKEEFAAKIAVAKESGSMASEILGLVSNELKEASTYLADQDFLKKKADDLLLGIDEISKSR